MEVFGIIGMSMGSSALVFALMACNRVGCLERKLKDAGVLNAVADSPS